MFGPAEIAIVLVIVLIVFGAGKLPSVMKDVGKGIRSFKNAVDGDDALDRLSDDSPSEETSKKIEEKKEVSKTKAKKKTVAKKKKTSVVKKKTSTTKKKATTKKKSSTARKKKAATASKKA